MFLNEWMLVNTYGTTLTCGARHGHVVHDVAFCWVPAINAVRVKKYTLPTQWCSTLEVGRSDVVGKDLLEVLVPTRPTRLVRWPLLTDWHPHFPPC